jgi:hypothetical protein
MPLTEHIMKTCSLSKHISTLAADMRKQVLNILQHSGHVTLGADGWTNTRRDLVTNIVGIAAGRAYYWTSIVNSDEHNTAQWLFEHIQPVVADLIGNNVKVVAFAVDNASVMVSFVGLIQQAFPFIIHVPCAAHTLQLIVKSMLDVPAVKQLVDVAIELINKFHKKKIYRLKLKHMQKAMNEKQKVVIKPNKTRWNSMYYAFKRLLSIQQVINTLLISMKENDGIDEMFWKKLTELVYILQPFQVLTQVLQSDTATLGDIHDGFYKIHSGLDKHINGMFGATIPQFKLIVEDRWDKSVNEDLVVAICILTLSHDELIKRYTSNNTHVSNTSLMIQKGQTFIIDWGIKYAKQYMRDMVLTHLNLQLAQYLGKGGVFVNVDEVRSTYPNVFHFWSWYRNSTPALSNIAQALLSITPSEAAVERTFSAQGNVHRDVRNRLSNEKIENEMFIKFNERALSSDVIKPDQCEELDIIEISTENTDIF